MAVPDDQITPFSLCVKEGQRVQEEHEGPRHGHQPISSSMRQMAFMRQMMDERAKVALP